MNKKPKGYTNIQNVGTEGYYVGSASNMARLLIFIVFILMLAITSVSFYFGLQLGNLEHRISILEKNNEISERT